MVYLKIDLLIVYNIDKQCKWAFFSEYCTRR